MVKRGTMLRRSMTGLFTIIQRRCFSSASVAAASSGSVPPMLEEKIVASVVFERPPLVLPKIHPAVYAFHEFSYWNPVIFLIFMFLYFLISILSLCAESITISDGSHRFRWRLQHCRQYPDEFLSREKGEPQMKITPVQRTTEADKSNDQKSLQRALDNQLYLLLFGQSFGSPDGEPVWHFPEKVYGQEDSLRLCAESALKSVLGGLEQAYFTSNTPLAHVTLKPKECSAGLTSYKRFFFKAQLLGTSKLEIGKCEDYVWVTKVELLQYFPEHTSILEKMIISES